MPDIKAIQKELKAAKLDGWLFYDHHHRDPIAANILNLAGNGMATRRWFYFIPARASRENSCTELSRARSNRSRGKQNRVFGLGRAAQGAGETAFGQQKNRDAVFAGKQYSVHRPGGRRNDRADPQAQEKSGEFGGPGAEIRGELERRSSSSRISSAGKIVDRITREAFRARGDIRARRKADDRIRAATVDARRISRERADHRRAAHRRRATEQRQPALRTESGWDRARFALGDLLLLDIWAKLAQPGSVYYDITWVGYLGERVPGAYAKIFGIVKQRARRARSISCKESVAKRRARFMAGKWIASRARRFAKRATRNISCIARGTASARKFTATAQTWTDWKRATTEKSCRTLAFPSSREFICRNSASAAK